MTKKSIDEVQKNKRKYTKKGERESKRFNWKSITESDFKEVQKEYPYLQKDIDGIYFIDRQGKRQEVVFPYVPILDDDSCLRILYKKPYGREKKQFPYQVIDNMQHLTKVFIMEERKEVIKWRIVPNDNGDKKKKSKNYAIATNPGRLPQKVKDLTTKDNVSLHKMIMALTFPEDMKPYREANDKSIASYHIDHISNNEYDCRLRNMWFTTRNTNRSGKRTIDDATLLDRICIYRKTDAKGMPIYKSQKIVFVMMLGNYTKGEWKSLGLGNEVKDNNIKDGKIQYNFIEYKENIGNIVCAMFDGIDNVENWYKNCIFTKDGQKLENIAERNEKIRVSLQKYLNNKEEIPGLEKMVLLANTNEANGYIEFDNIIDQEQSFIKAKKRGLIVETQERGTEKAKRYFSTVKSIDNLKLNSDNIIDVLYPYFNQIFKD